jgi:hypothetical protein
MRILKKIWEWVSHGDTVWGILNMMFPTLGGIGGGVITWITSLHPAIIFFSILGGIAIGLLISNEIAARRIQKRLATGLPIKAAMTENTSQLGQEIIASDLKRVYKGMRGRTTRWEFSGIYNREPYFEVFVELTNTTIFTFSLKSLSGFMKIAGEQCVNLPQVSTRFGITREEPTDIRIRQPIAPETVIIIQEAGNRDREIEFNLGEVTFEIENTTEGYERYKPHMTGGIYNIVPKDGIKIEDKLDIKVSDCYFAEKQLQPLETLTLIVELTVHVLTVPSQLASLKLCIGQDEIDPIEPELPIIASNSDTSYLATYEVSISKLIVGSNRKEPGRICTFALGQKWSSNEFQIPYDSPLLPQEVK